MEPQELFKALSKWFWAVPVLLTLLNAAAFERQGRRENQQRPDIIRGYRSIAVRFAIWGSLPWIVMGVGCVFGGVSSVFDYFRPRDGNPYVLAFFCSVFVAWALGTYWLVFLGGAQKLIEHPGLLNVTVKSRRGVMFYWFLSLAGGIVGTVLMFFHILPVPHL